MQLLVLILRSYSIFTSAIYEALCCFKATFVNFTKLPISIFWIIKIVKI